MKNDLNLAIQPEEEPRGFTAGVPVYCAFDEILPLDRLTPQPKVNNEHPDRQIELLAKIILTAGWRAAVTISTRSGFITKGHGRLLAATFAGLGRVPVEYQHYADEAAELADLSADNKIAELSHADEEKTRQLLLDLQAFSADFELAGFELAEIDKIIAPGTQGKKDPDDLPEIDPEAPPRTTPGTLWTLGNHRLLCADATSPKSAATLMRGEPAAMIFTDPPYHRWFGGRKQDTVTNLPDGVLIQENNDKSALITVDIGLQRVVLKVPAYEIRFTGDDSLQSIWKIAKPLKSEDHPTKKWASTCPRPMSRPNWP